MQHILFAFQRPDDSFQLSDFQLRLANVLQLRPATRHSTSNHW